MPVSNFQKREEGAESDRVRSPHLDATTATALRAAGDTMQSCVDKPTQHTCREACEACQFAARLCYDCGLPACMQAVDALFNVANIARSGPSDKLKEICAKAVAICTATATECDQAAAEQRGDSDRSDGDPDGLSLRSLHLQPATANDQDRTVTAVLATDAPAFSIDLKTGKSVHEVWCMDGGVYGESVPLIDNHNRSSARNVVGSVTHFQPGDHDLTGQLAVSEAERSLWTKIKEGHIRSVSGGIAPLETTVVPAGQSRQIKGRTYTARDDQPLYVHTRWRLREVSLTPIGADPAAKIRSLSQGVHSMDERLRKLLEDLGLVATATEPEAQAFLQSLPAPTQLALTEKSRKDAQGKKEEDDEDDDENEEERKDRMKKREECRKRAKEAEAADEKETEEERKERLAARKRSKEAKRSDGDGEGGSVRAERQRVERIHELGDKEAPDLVRKAIDGEWTVSKFEEHLSTLTNHRTRTEGAAPAGHVRSHERECTSDALGMALSMRSLDSLALENPEQSRNPLNLFGSYQPASGNFERAATDWRFRQVRDAEARERSINALLEQSDRYRGLSLFDMCRECCRMEGTLRTSYDYGETIRAAVSGSALAAIFTTNFNAQFLAGSLDAVDTTAGWVTESDVPNFQPAERATVGKMGQLQRLTKGQKAQDLDINDWNEILCVYRYAGKFVVDEQDIIDDRFGAIEQVSPMEMGLTARQIRPNLIYSLLMSNPTLTQDGNSVFDASNHTNYATAGSKIYDASTSSVYAGPLQTAISAMGAQKIRTRPLNLFPRFLLVPTTLRWAAAILLQSAERVIASGSGGTFNPLRDLGIEPRVDARLNAAGCVNPLTGAVQAGSDTQWFLACRPGEQGAKTAEVGYLRGTGRAPQIRSYVLEHGQWGIGWDIKHDIGAAILDFRGFYSGSGVS